MAEERIGTKLHILNGDDVQATAMLVCMCRDVNGLPGDPMGWMEVTDLRAMKIKGASKAKRHKKKKVLIYSTS
jgi:hypothetical protein